MAFREVASQTFQFLVELVRIVVWRTMVRLPWTLITSVAVLLAVAGPGQHLINLHVTSSAIHWFTLVLWFLCFGLAGILWGLHRAVFDSAHEGIRHCQEKGADAASAAIDPVLARLPAGKSEYPLGFLREQWKAWTSELVWRDPESRWYSPAAYLTNWLARKWVEVQAAVVTQTLDELEAFGEKAVSAASLKRFVVHRSASAMAEAARSKVRFWTYVTAAVVFLLIVSPAVLTTTISVLTRTS